MATAADTAKMRAACTVFLHAGMQNELEQLRAKAAEQADKIKELQEELAWHDDVKEAKRNGSHDEFMECMDYPSYNHQLFSRYE